MTWKRGKRKKKPRKKHSYRGQVMASKSECRFAEWLDSVQIPWMYETDQFQWCPPIAIYTPDFKIGCADGTCFFIEYKGYLRPSDKTKMKYVRQQHPTLDVRFVFENGEKPVPGATKRKDGTKMTHIEWAASHGYAYVDLGKKRYTDMPKRKALDTLLWWFKSADNGRVNWDDRVTRKEWMEGKR